MVESHNPAMLADAMAKLIEDERLRERMGHASREMAEANFDEREVIRQTVEVYCNLSSRMPKFEQWSEDSTASLPVLAEQIVYESPNPIAG